MRERLRLAVRGAVQGVGFRPFVYRLARALELAGWVLNSPHGVIIEVEGPRERLDAFPARASKPSRRRTRSSSASRRRGSSASASDGFEIRDSAATGEPTALVLPDIATCDDCRRELFDPDDRRYRYPFINCTHCGPRFSIIDALPYDRARTSMRDFTMCPACAARVPTIRPIAGSTPSRTPVRSADRSWRCGTPRSRAGRARRGPARRGRCASPRPDRGRQRARRISSDGRRAPASAPSGDCVTGSIARRSRSR